MRKFTGKRPTWRTINSKECVPMEKHRKENEQIKKTLKNRGFEIWDSGNIYMEGYQISARKLIPEFHLHKNPYMYFSWIWYDEVDWYWRAQMRASYDYIPTEKFMHPWGSFEIIEITRKSLHLLPTMESRIISAMTTQSVLLA